MEPKKIEILIVEDSRTQAEVLKYILENNNYSVRHANDGQEALEILNGFIPDIIISDIVMPGMDGYQFCSVIKADNKLKKIPVILLTALSVPRDVIKGLECGADSFLVKPYTEELLIARIEYFIQNSELRKNKSDDSPLEILFGDQKFDINSSRQQIMDVLFSTYENSILRNQELIESNKNLQIAQDKLTLMNVNLELLVKLRTQELQSSNEKLLQDITEREFTEAALSKSEEKWRTLVNTIPDYVGLYDRDGKYLFLNHFAKGFSMKDIEGKSYADFLLGGAKIIYDNAFEKAKLTRKPQYVQYTAYGDNWSSKEYESYIVPIYEDEQLVNMMVIARDITERKETEEALKESEQQLKELNATKDKFFSIIAHDMKSPFIAIMGFSDILAEKIREKNYEGIEEYAGIIQNSSKRAMILLKNLMEWSSSQTGRMAFKPEAIEIDSLINEIAELSNDSARQKSISISLELPVKAVVCADKAMINTILRNLISNAIKFTNEGGMIIISTEHNQDKLIVTVQDNGVGLNKETINRLFRIEESYSTMGTQKEVGTGLGLLLCKEFILKHGGEIWVESEPGQGSKFHFSLPII